MPYVKHNFTNGKILEANDLVDIENTISELNSSYTTHNFRNGMSLKASHLDEMEEGLISISPSYQKHNFVKGMTLNSDDLDIIEDELVDRSYDWNFPDDYRTDLDDVISKVKIVNQNTPKNSHVEFIAFADMHKDTVNSESEFYRMMNAIKYLTHRLDIAFVVNLGDICYSSDGNMDTGVFDEAKSAAEELNSPYIITMGNHDYIPHEKRRELATNFEGAVFDTVGSWFYVDDNERCLRYIMLDSQDRGNDANSGTTVTTTSNACSDHSWKQLDWLANVALKTTNKVIFLQHQGLGAINSNTVREHSHINNYKIASTIAQAFQEGTSGSATYTIYYSAETTAKDVVEWDFSEQGKGTVLFNAFGHVHGDTLYNSTTSTATPFNEFTFDNALCRESTYVGESVTRTINTITEIAFDVVSVDLEKNKVHCYRCGAGNDREITLLFSKEDAEVDFSNGTDISDRFSFTVKGPILWADGTQNTSNTSSFGSDYTNIAGYKYLNITQLTTTSTSTANGLAFYDADKKYISGKSQIAGASSLTYTYSTVEVPSNAVYIRTTWWQADNGTTGSGSWNSGEFSCIAI